MLTKEKSKQVVKLKYLLLLPLVFGMLLYTSCEEELESSNNLNETLLVVNIENLTDEEETEGFTKLEALSKQLKDWSFVIKDENSTVTFTQGQEGSGISGPYGKIIRAKMNIESKILNENFDLFNSNAIQSSAGKNDIPFGVVDEVPVFPGCENETNKRACFNEMMQKHISKNFRYPQKAQELGIQGRVSTMFTIIEDGSIQNLRMRGPDSLLKNEVARIIGRLPEMKPGKQDGKAVRVPFSIPISFRLEQGSLDLNVTSDSKNDIPFSIVEEVPVFPGCEEDDNRRSCFNKMMQKHISKNFSYPLEAQEKGIQGRVNIMFTISEDGTIQNSRQRGPDVLLEKEAARIIELLPKMIPGKQKGKAVNVPFSIPITFKLQ